MCGSKDNIKVGLGKIRGWECLLDKTGRGHDPLARSYEYGYKNLGSVNAENYYTTVRFSKSISDFAVQCTLHRANARIVYDKKMRQTFPKF